MQYLRPADELELENLMQTLPLDQTHWLAGGTDLLPAWDLGRSAPRYLVDLKQLSSFRDIRDEGDRVRIGALTTVEELKQNEVIQNCFGALHQATEQFAGVQIRHRATIGGNICNASPAGDLLPGLYAYDAILEIAGPSGKRDAPVRDFIQAPGKTCLQLGEVLVSIILPKVVGQDVFFKLGLRQAMAIAVVNLAIVSEKNASGFNRLVIAAGAVAPTVVFLKEFTAAVLQGESPKEALPLIDRDIAPIDDLRATARYRRMVLKNIVLHLMEHLHV